MTKNDIEYLEEEEEEEEEELDASPSDDEEEEEGEEEEEEEQRAEPVKKESKAAEKRRTDKGIVYLSRIPFSMTPMILRSMFEDRVGPVGRMNLKLKEMRGTKEQKKKQRNHRLYSEGWVEFIKKKHAKRAALMNCTQVGGSRKALFAHELWNIKYLSGFTWDDLQEEGILKKQYMRREVARVQKEGLKAAESYRKTLSEKDNSYKQKRRRTPSTGSNPGGPKRRSSVYI